MGTHQLPGGQRGHSARLQLLRTGSAATFKWINQLANTKGGGDPSPLDPPQYPNPERVRTSRCNLRAVTCALGLSLYRRPLPPEPKQSNRDGAEDRHPDRTPGHVPLLRRQIDRVPRVREEI